MKILVINCGSSSLKYQLIDMDTEVVMAKGNFERIGDESSFLTHKVNDQKYVIERKVLNHEQALEIIIEQLLCSDYGVIKDLEEINAVGHRVVHGGEYFSEPSLVNEDVIMKIQDCAKLAPLHNPATIQGIRACQNKMPKAKMAVVFDTAFHQTMPKENYIYPIPYIYYEKHRIRKYGAHGTSHSYVSKRLAEKMEKKMDELKIIVCHLGQGASICAVKNGESQDTSMGLTPLGGIPMCARSGDLDPSVVTYIMEQENLNAEEIIKVLNKKSGVYGISNVSTDFRDIEKAASEGNEFAKLSLNNYEYTVAQFIAKYMVTLQGLDAIAFTAGIGENQINVRKRICEKLEFLGVKIDPTKNNTRGEECEISADDSKIKVWVIPTNEELMIAKETEKLVK